MATFGCQDQNEKKEQGGSALPVFDSKGIEKFNQSETNVISGAGVGGAAPVLSAVTDEDLGSVTKNCGVGDLADKEKVIFSSQMEYTYTRKIHSGVAVAYVPITSILNLVGTLSTTVLDVDVKVGKVSGESVLGPVTDLKPIEEQAEILAKAFRGPAISYMEPPGVKKEPQWSGLVCNISARKLVSKRAGYETVSQLTPQFLPNVSPLASRERQEKEIPQFRVFGPITAKVQESNHPALKGLTEVTGNIVVERIDPKQRKDRNIEGDSAFRITNNFKSEEVTLALGLHLWTEYYIDHKTRQFSAVVANVGDDDIMYFIGKYEGDGGGDTKAESPKYEPQIKNLVNNSCIRCHNSGQKASDVILGSYAEVKAAGPKILDVVTRGVMPKEESEKLKPDAVGMIRRWAEQGYQ
jgi:hypothetical protein